MLKRLNRNLGDTCIRKSQISVFILIAVLIILLFVFLLFIGNDDKKGNLEDSKSAIILENNQELKTLKSAMDQCLEMELKKALIISGLRGGFIYNKGEYYFPGTIPPDTYSQTLIANLGLNWNNLESRTLVHSQAQVFSPGISEDAFMYNHSVTDDIEKYISKGFVDCLNFENSEKLFYINFTDYLGKVKQVDYDNKIIEIYNIDASQGDTIDVDLSGQTITGIVEQYERDKNSFLVRFEDVSFLQSLTVEEMANLDVINMNRTINLSVNINNEDVSANLNFPIRIKNKNFQTSYEDTTVTVPVRLRSLILLSKELLSYKYLHEKNIDYMESDNVVRVLNNSKYFQSTKLLNLSFSKKILVDEKEHKRYIYSFIDEDSRILGKPFVLNFGYENIAPKINFSFIDDSLMIAADDQVITLLSTQNDVIGYNLRDFTFEKQYWDDYILYFEDEYYYGPDAEFVLTESGELNFTPFMEKVYRYNIHVTDGETTREHILEFVTGFPDNSGNQAADECFSFKNSEDINRQFPINYRYKSKVYKYEDEGEFTFFGLVNYIPNSVISGYNPGMLFFAKSCVFDTSKFEIAVTSKAPDGTTSALSFQDYDTKYGIKIPNRPYMQEISVEVRSINSGTVMTEPYKFVVVPASCLGPSSEDNALHLTCCDTDLINTSVNDAINNKNVESIKLVSPSNLLSGDAIYDEDIYMCYNPDRDDIFNVDGYDYERNRLWDLNEQITSLFKTNMKLVCQGKYPKSEHNVERVGEPGTGYLAGEVVAIKNAGIRTDLDPPVSLRWEIAEEGTQCEICEISNYTSFGFIANIEGAQGLVFRVGEVDGNRGALSPYVGPVPGSGTSGWNELNHTEQEEYNDLFLLCDDEWEYTEDNGVTWTALPSLSSGDMIGLENFRQDIVISKKYCRQNDPSICEGRVDSPISRRSNDATSDSTNCQNYYLRYNDIGDFDVLSNANTGWMCAGETSTSCVKTPPACNEVFGYSSNECSDGVCQPPAGANPACPVCP